MYTFPMSSNGLSTGFAPIQVRITTVDVNIQNFAFLDVLNFVVLFLFFIFRAKIRIEAIRARTPPSFDGMDRRIA